MIFHSGGERRRRTGLDRSRWGRDRDGGDHRGRWQRYLRLGDVISATTVLESVSEEKRTRIGRGYFVTWVTTYVDQAGETVGRQLFRILKFAPEAVPT